VKTSGSNDAVHHISVAFNQNFGPSGTAGTAITFADAGAIQCSVLFRGDGTILLYSGDRGTGTILATYSGAFSSINTWYAYEFEVVIHPTAGSFTVRTNGSSVNSFQATGLNTRNGSANNYANQIRFNVSATMANLQFFDDLLWRSDPTVVPWVGDIRCNTRMPASDVQKQFTGVGSRTISNSNASGNVAIANRTWYGRFVAPVSGTVGTVTMNRDSSGTYAGNLKGAIYADNGSNAPGAVIQSASNIPNSPPPATTVTWTFSPPVAVTAGMTYYFAMCSDTSSSGNISLTNINSTTGLLGTTTYASFPVANPTGLSNNGAQFTTVVITLGMNAQYVSEAPHDGLTTYVYDTNPGDNDLYGLAALLPQPVGVIAVTTRALMQRADAGSRAAAVQVKSGGTVAQSTPTTPFAAGWGWVSRTDLVDPHTGVTWTRDAVDAIQVGPVVVS